MTRGQLTRAPETSTALVPLDNRHGGWNVNSVAHYGVQDQSVRYRALLRRHARAIVTILLTCLAIGGLATLLMPPLYKAQVVIQLLAENSDYMNNKDIDPNVSGSGTDSYLETETKLLASEDLSERVVASLLSRSTEYAAHPEGPLTKLKVALGMGKPGSSTLQSDIYKTLANLKIKPVGGSRLVSVTVSGPSAQLAADTANTIISQHIAALQEGRLATATQTTDFLTAQLSSMRAKLKQSDDDLQAYARKTGLIFTSGADKESVGSEKLRQVQSDLVKAESDRADKQAQMELMNSVAADTLPKVLDDGSLRESKSRLADLRRQLADLYSLYTPNHYKVKEVESQIATVESQIKQDVSAVSARVANDYRASARREALQRQAYENQLALVTDQSEKQIGYNLLKREADANRDLYQSMLQKIKEAGVVSALRASNIRVVDRAKPPASPYQPNALLNTGLGALVGIILSVLYILMRERMDSSIRTAGETTRLLQLPELAIVPSASRDIRTQIVAASSLSGRRLAGLITGRPSSSKADLSKDLVTNWRNTGSVVAESFRSAVASIILWGRNAERSHKVLVVTSAHSGAGKTTTVLNLGLGLVESGRRVLLIDGDMRLPRLGEIFGVNTALGLADALAENFNASLVRNLIIDTSLQGLSILPSGRQFTNVTELLHLSQLATLVEDLRSEYDFILIDSPPALPLTDARLLAHHADGVILVVRAGSTTVEQSFTVQQSLAQDGTHLIGTILNHWDAKGEDPAYMTSYMKYAVAPRHDSRARGEMPPRRRAAGAGD